MKDAKSKALKAKMEKGKKKCEDCGKMKCECK